MSIWLDRAAAWLTLRRIRAHTIVLALCLWGACTVDFATPGLFDRAGNIKFQDFLQFPISASLIAHGRAAYLYDDHVLNQQIRAIVGRNTTVYLQYLYGPQVALPFAALLPFPFLIQAEVWVAFSLLVYFGCVYLIWKQCPALARYKSLVALTAIAYPPLFHFFVRGQLSAIVLLCFTAAYVALQAKHEWLAGIALGVLAFKPQFLVAIPIILLIAKTWKVLTGLVISAAAQLAFSYFCFGRDIMQNYAEMLLRSARNPGSTELIFSPLQMHSLRSFWELLIPSHAIVAALYMLSSLTVIAIATTIWKTSSPLALRFSALLLAAVLVNPHLYIYDLLALAPMFLLLADWSMCHAPAPPALRVLLYLAFLLPLFGPLARWTHLQLSVVAFVALLWIVYRATRLQVAHAPLEVKQS